MTGVCVEDEQVCPYAARKGHIFTIWRYIAEDTETAADRVEEAIYDACAAVAVNPLCGHSRRELTKRPLLFWTVTKYPNYIIAYRFNTSPLQVVAVLHGKRDVRRLLKKRF